MHFKWILTKFNLWKFKFSKFFENPVKSIRKISILWPPGPPGGRRPTGVIVINSVGNGVSQAIALTIFMNIVRAFPCLTPFPAEFLWFFFCFRILTPGASWRPKADWRNGLRYEPWTSRNHDFWEKKHSDDTNHGQIAVQAGNNVQDWSISIFNIYIS